MNKWFFLLSLIALGACQQETHVSQRSASDVVAASNVSASGATVEIPNLHKWDYFEKKR